MSLTPRKTTTKALRKLTRALAAAGAPRTPVTIPAEVLSRIITSLDIRKELHARERIRAVKNGRAYQELLDRYNADRQRAQDNARTPDGSDYARGARAAEQEERIRANERARILTWARGDAAGTTDAATVTELRAGLISQRATQITSALALTGPGRALDQYRRLRTKYSAEHDAAQHERADFRNAALALLLRPDMKVAVTSNNGREKVNVLFSAEALWEGTGLGTFPADPQGPARGARNDALAAALLMCALDRDTTTNEDGDDER